MVPAIIISIGSLILPDTPNSLIERGKREEAMTKLRRIRGENDVKNEFNDLVAASEASKKVEHPWRNLLERKYWPHLTMAIAIPFFQQLTGINVIMFYAPVLFKTIGFEDNASLMSAVITGGVNVLATMVSIYGVDKWGRRFLFLEGGVQMFICQVLLSTTIYFFWHKLLYETVSPRDFSHIWDSLALFHVVSSRVSLIVIYVVTSYNYVVGSLVWTRTEYLCARVHKTTSNDY